MFEYFWKQQDDIPAGMGYPLFGASHLISVAITLGLVILAAVLIRRMEVDGKRDSDDLRNKAIENNSNELRNYANTQRTGAYRKILRCIPIAMVLLELFKDGFLIKVGRFGIGYLPLHICSIGIFVFLLREFVGAKDILGEIAVILIMPASLAGLIFADWTELYPVLNFINLHSYLWHGLLILYPLILLISGEVKPSVRHSHWIILFLCVIVPPIYIFDKHFNCNYFFINWPVPDSPLEWMASFMGNPGYLIGYVLLSMLTMLVVYLAIATVQKHCRR